MCQENIVLQVILRNYSLKTIYSFSRIVGYNQVTISYIYCIKRERKDIRADCRRERLDRHFCLMRENGIRD